MRKNRRIQEKRKTNSGFSCQSVAGNIYRVYAADEHVLYAGELPGLYTRYGGWAKERYRVSGVSLFQRSDG